jgi:hypothetical protein
MWNASMEFFWNVDYPFPVDVMSLATVKWFIQ